MRPLLCIASLVLSVAAFAPAQAQNTGAGEVRTYSWDNGDNFSGEIRNGLPNGPGTFTTGGRAYSGEWKDGCLTIPDGRRFAVFTTFDKCPVWKRPRMPRQDFK